MQVFGKDAALALVIILQSNQAEKCGADVCVVGPNGVCNPAVPDARTGQAEEGVVDFGCDAAVIPRKTRVHADIRRAARNEGLEEIVGIAEHDEARRAQRIPSDHVQQFHLDGIGQKTRECIDVARSGINRGQSRSVMLELARNSRVARRLAADVKRGRHVKVNVEWRLGEIECRIFLAEQRLNVGQDFANGVRSRRACRVGASSVDAIAGAIERRPSCVMVVFIRSKDEERVAGRNAVVS